MHGEIPFKEMESLKNSDLTFSNTRLNESQRKAVIAVAENEHLGSALHGPLGTGKTTTLIEAIIQLIKKGEKVLGKDCTQQYSSR